MKKTEEKAKTVRYETRTILIREIEVGRQALRHDPFDDSITELALDIQARGMMQPIGVEVLEENHYQLRWGGRRLSAHIRLRHETVWAAIYQPGDESIEETAARENIQRINMTLQEEVNVINLLYERDRKSPDQIASALGKSREWVMRRIAIPNLPEEVKTPLLEGRISVGAAEAIARCEDQSARNWLISETARSNLTIAQVRELVGTMEKNVEANKKMEPAVQAGLAARPSEIIIPCSKCGTPRKISEITSIILRVCTEACPEISERETGPNGPTKEE